MEKNERLAAEQENTEVKLDDDRQSVEAVDDVDGVADLPNHSSPNPKICTQKGNGRVEDHFSLPAQSSTLRFRNSVLRVYPNTNNTQFVRESIVDTEGKDERTLIKQTREASPGLVVLRGTYTLVTLCLGGALVVYSVVFLLNLVTDFTMFSGMTSITTPHSLGISIGVFLALPGSIFGFSSALVICSSFIADTWKGSRLLRIYCFSNFSAAIFDWCLFICFFGLPVFVMCLGLLTGRDNWWEVGLITWFLSVTCVYMMFAFTATYIEVMACWNLVTFMSSGEAGETLQSFWRTVRACILTIRTYSLSGYKDVTYLTTGSTHVINHITHPEILQDSLRERTRWFTRLTMLGCCSGELSPKFYHVLGEPQRMWSIDEIQGSRSFLTRSTWSLEKVYCTVAHGRQDWWQLCKVLKRSAFLKFEARWLAGLLVDFSLFLL